MRRLVLDLNDKRPIWAIPGWAVGDVRASLPEDWEVHVATTPADGSGDGVGGGHPEVLQAVSGAEVYVGIGIPPEILRAGGETLRWVHSGAAGVGGSLTPEMRRGRVLFTNSAGIHGPPIGEAVLGMILHFARGFDFAVRGQARSEWWTEPFLRADTPVREIAGSTVGILGLGGIGREVAKRVRPLGARAIGWKRKAGDAGEEVDELVVGEEGRNSILEESDYLVVAVPETPLTRGMIGREALGLMKEGSVLVNVARGGIVDSVALVDALKGGHLRGAALDVFQPEPLPEDHPLWQLPNVLITPHVSAVTRAFWRRETDLITENVERYLSGRPLRNLVDLEAGY